MRKLDEKAKTTKEIAELWNRYCKEGFTEVPQQIMELMEVIWVRLEDAQYLELDNKMLHNQLDSELAKTYELKQKLQQTLESHINAYPLDNKVDAEVRKVLHKIFEELLK